MRIVFVFIPSSILSMLTQRIYQGLLLLICLASIRASSSHEAKAPGAHLRQNCCPEDRSNLFLLNEQPSMLLDDNSYDNSSAFHPFSHNMTEDTLSLSMTAPYSPRLPMESDLFSLFSNYSHNFDGYNSSLPFRTGWEREEKKASFNPFTEEQDKSMNAPIPLLLPENEQSNLVPSSVEPAPNMVLPKNKNQDNTLSRPSFTDLLKKLVAPQQQPSSAKTKREKMVEKMLKVGKLRLAYYDTEVKCNFPGCSAAFIKRANLDRHKKKVHLRIKDKKIPLYCNFPECDKFYYYVGDLNRHKKKVHEKKYDCRSLPCKASFSSSSELRAHQKTYHPSPLHYCDIGGCNKSYTLKSNLKKHQKQKHEGFTYVCNICQKPYADPSGLRNHKISKHTTYRFCCDEPGCQKSYTSSGNLRRHKAKVHTNPGISFTSPKAKSLKKRKKKLTFKKDKRCRIGHFPCKFLGCHKTYRYLSSERRHERTCSFAPRRE